MSPHVAVLVLGIAAAVTVITRWRQVSDLIGWGRYEGVARDLREAADGVYLVPGGVRTFCMTPDCHCQATQPHPDDPAPAPDDDPPRGVCIDCWILLHTRPTRETPR